MIFKIIAIILMGIFYICYFAKMFSQKRKGINTDQLGKGKKGFVKCIEIALKVTTYILPLLQIVSILLSSKSDNTVLSIVGVAVEMLGVIVFILSVTEMKDNWRAGVQREEKTSLVTSGIYSMSRNPAFLGFELMYIGILVAFFNWYLLIATIIALILFHLQIIKVEEVFLIDAFGDEYFKYKNKVFRYFGRKFWIK